MLTCATALRACWVGASYHDLAGAGYWATCGDKLVVATFVGSRDNPATMGLRIRALDPAARGILGECTVVGVGVAQLQWPCMLAAPAIELGPKSGK
jgi:hypothetical protein